MDVETDVLCEVEQAIRLTDDPTELTVVDSDLQAAVEMLEQVHQRRVVLLEQNYVNVGEVGLYFELWSRIHLQAGQEGLVRGRQGKLCRPVALRSELFMQVGRQVGYCDLAEFKAETHLDGDIHGIIDFKLVLYEFVHCELFVCDLLRHLGFDGCYKCQRIISAVLRVESHFLQAIAVLVENRKKLF